MDILHILQNRLSTGVLSAVRLEPGSIIEGRVTELYPGNMAKLLVNGKNITAALQTGVEKNRTYWFRVEPSDAIPLLKILREAGTVTKPEKLLPVLNTEGTRANMETVRMLHKEGMPLMGSQIEAITKIRIQDNVPQPKMAEALTLLHLRGVTVQTETIRAALALSDAHNLGSALRSSYEAVPKGSEEKFPFLQAAGARTIVPQLQLIERLINESLIQQGAKRDMLLHVLFGNQKPSASTWPDKMQQMMRDSGQMRGAEPASGVLQINLTEDSFPKLRAQPEFPQLRQDLQTAALLQSTFTRNLLLDHSLLFPKSLPGTNEPPGSSLELGKVKAELALLKTMVPKTGTNVDAAARIISGLQLLSAEQVQAPGFLSAIPFPLDQIGMQIQWSGKKMPDGSLDQNHCRMLFYLQMENFGEMTIDVQIQKRIVSIAVYSYLSEPPDLKGRWYKKLESALFEKQYILSGVVWKNNPDQPKRDAAQKRSFHSGKVDIRI